VVTRRQFLKQLSLGMAAGAVGLPVPVNSLGVGFSCDPGAEILRVALLADSHLPDGNPETSAARHLIDAVAQINALIPPADVVLVAGDLTDHGNIESLLLGRAILSSLQAPYWIIPGERDILSGPRSPWSDIFGHSSFSFLLMGVHLCGFDTTEIEPATGNRFFQFSAQQYRWLSRELIHSSPETPLLILSHAPLYRLFQPWQWWTEKVETLHDLLLSREKVYLLHGHVHQNIALRQENLIFQGLRSTAWPQPDVRMGFQSSQVSTFSVGNRLGCGWMLLTVNRNGNTIIEDHLWGL
jgi:3',5'-cyclic-AMP phosphodiesterase